MADFDMSSVLQQIVGKAAGDNSLLEQLKNEPAKALENMTGIDLPDEQIDAVVKKMGGIEGLVKAYNEGGADGVLKEAAIAGAENAISGTGSSSSKDSDGGIVGDLLEGVLGGSSSDSSGGNAVGELLEGVLGGGEETTSKKSSKKSSSKKSESNAAGEILEDLLGGK